MIRNEASYLSHIFCNYIKTSILLYNHTEQLDQVIVTHLPEIKREMFKFLYCVQKENNVFDDLTS